MTTPLVPETAADPGASRAVPRQGPGATLWLVILYASAVTFATWWPAFMVTKVLPSIVNASGGEPLKTLLDFHGAPLLGVVASLALGDFVARRHSGGRAFIFAGVLFGLVFVVSWWFSRMPSMSFVQAYGLVWPPHLLFALAGVALRGRREFQRSAEYLGLLGWLVAGALALGFSGWLSWLRWGAGHLAPTALLVTCVGVSLMAMVRTVRIMRGLREARAPSK